jgi:hypothetical protein
VTGQSRAPSANRAVPDPCSARTWLPHHDAGIGALRATSLQNDLARSYHEATGGADGLRLRFRRRRFDMVGPSLDTRFTCQIVGWEVRRRRPRSSSLHHARLHPPLGPCCHVRSLLDLALHYPSRIAQRLPDYYESLTLESQARAQLSSQPKVGCCRPRCTPAAPTQTATPQARCRYVPLPCLLGGILVPFREAVCTEWRRTASCGIGRAQCSSTARINLRGAISWQAVSRTV